MIPGEPPGPAAAAQARVHTRGCNAAQHRQEYSNYHAVQIRGLVRKVASGIAN